MNLCACDIEQREYGEESEDVDIGGCVLGRWSIHLVLKGSHTGLEMLHTETQMSTVPKYQ